MKELKWSKAACMLCALCAAAAIASSAQTFAKIVSFDGTHGTHPFFGSLVQGANGEFYGTTFSGGANNQGMVFKLTAAGKLTTLYSFCS